MDWNERLVPSSSLNQITQVSSTPAIPRDVIDQITSQDQSLTDPVKFILGSSLQHSHLIQSHPDAKYFLNSLDLSLHDSPNIRAYVQDWLQISSTTGGPDLEDTSEQEDSRLLWKMQRRFDMYLTNHLLRYQSDVGISRLWEAFLKILRALDPHNLRSLGSQSGQWTFYDGSELLVDMICDSFRHLVNSRYQLLRSLLIWAVHVATQHRNLRFPAPASVTSRPQESAQLFAAADAWDFGNSASSSSVSFQVLLWNSGISQLLSLCHGYSMMEWLGQRSYLTDRKVTISLNPINELTGHGLELQHTVHEASLLRALVSSYLIDRATNIKTPSADDLANRERLPNQLTGEQLHLLPPLCRTTILEEASDQLRRWWFFHPLLATDQPQNRGVDRSALFETASLLVSESWAQFGHVSQLAQRLAQVGTQEAVTDGSRTHRSRIQLAWEEPRFLTLLGDVEAELGHLQTSQGFYQRAAALRRLSSCQSLDLRNHPSRSSSNHSGLANELRDNLTLISEAAADVTSACLRDAQQLERATSRLISSSSGTPFDSHTPAGSSESSSVSAKSKQLIHQHFVDLVLELTQTALSSVLQCGQKVSTIHQTYVSIAQRDKVSLETLEATKQSAQAEIVQQLDLLRSNWFSLSASVKDYLAAYTSLVSIKDRETRSQLLRRFLHMVSVDGQTHLLATYPWIGIRTEMVSILKQMADHSELPQLSDQSKPAAADTGLLKGVDRSSDAHPGRSNSTNYYQIIYSILYQTGNFQDAASYLHHYALRLEAASLRSLASEAPSSTDRRILSGSKSSQSSDTVSLLGSLRSTLQTVISTLSLVPSGVLMIFAHRDPDHPKTKESELDLETITLNSLRRRLYFCTCRLELARLGLLQFVQHWSFPLRVFSHGLGGVKEEDIEAVDESRPADPNEFGAVSLHVHRARLARMVREVCETLLKAHSPTSPRDRPDLFSFTPLVAMTLQRFCLPLDDFFIHLTDHCVQLQLQQLPSTSPTQNYLSTPDLGGTSPASSSVLVEPTLQPLTSLSPTTPAQALSNPLVGYFPPLQNSGAFLNIPPLSCAAQGAEDLLVRTFPNSSASAAWAQLRHYLRTLDTNEESGYRYRTLVCDRILSSDPRLELPGWLIDLFGLGNLVAPRFLSDPIPSSGAWGGPEERKSSDSLPITEKHAVEDLLLPAREQELRQRGTHAWLSLGNQAPLADLLKILIRHSAWELAATLVIDHLRFVRDHPSLHCPQSATADAGISQDTPQRLGGWSAWGGEDESLDPPLSSSDEDSEDESVGFSKFVFASRLKPGPSIRLENRAKPSSAEPLDTPTWIPLDLLVDLLGLLGAHQKKISGTPGGQHVAGIFHRLQDEVTRHSSFISKGARDK